jgi:hypothetical protein
MSIEDAILSPRGKSPNVVAMTLITVVCLATAIIVLAIDWQIKRDVIKAANEARATLDEWKVAYEQRPAPGPARRTGKRGAVRGNDAPSLGGAVLPGATGVEAGSAPDGSSAQGGKPAGGPSANGTPGNRSGGVPASGKPVGA